MLLPALTALVTLGCVAEPAAIQVPDDADIVLVADDLFYEPDRIEVPAGEPISLHLRNDGGIVHDLVLDTGWSSGEVRPGEAVTVTMGPLASSTTAWCSVPGHRDAGMELDVLVGGSGS
ncbi:MAG: cupredoxin domain-containing protein [Nitriliruptoraceae bacterium]